MNEIKLVVTGVFWPPRPEFVIGGLHTQHKGAHNSTFDF